MAYKLLLADDSVTIQRVIELTFADEDIQVVAVSDGEQAIARVEADPPDIVLADVGMPGRDGYDVAAHLKRSPRLAHIPVVLLTGAFEPIDRARFDSIGCDGVLAKPFEPQQVIGRVKELLARERTPVAAGDVAALAHSPDLQRYFDSLDEALASTPRRPDRDDTLDIPELTSEPPGPPGSAALPAPASSSPAPAASAGVTKPAPALSSAQTGDTADGGAVGARAPQAQPAAPQPPAAAPSATQAARPAPTARMPALADAFAALLAAEQGTPLPAGSPAWPAIAPLPAAPVVTEELVEQVCRRVLERLTDRVVRETVSEIVSAVAERLVREELERLKESIKDTP